MHDAQVKVECKYLCDRILRLMILKKTSSILTMNIMVGVPLSLKTLQQ